MLSYFHDVLLL